MSYLLVRAVRRAMFPSGIKIEDVFSIDGWIGNQNSLDVVSGLDMTGDTVGLVWIKGRSATGAHILIDTERGLDLVLQSHSTSAELDFGGGGISSFNTDGYTVGASANVNLNGGTHVGWSFKKAPRFFDVIKYTGDGIAGRTVAHALGVVPGMVVVKNLTSAVSWAVQHISRGGTKVLSLDTSSAEVTVTTRWNDTDANATNVTLGAAIDVNALSSDYIMYVFAHDPANNGVIQCGQYTGNGSTTGPVIDLGWQPQYIMIKKATGTTANWIIVDTARGMGAGNEALLWSNLSNTEVNQELVNLTSTGFDIAVTLADTNESGQTYIYMAIRAEDV